MLAVSMLLGKSPLKQPNYSHHLAAITSKRSDMLIHVIELNYFMLIEVLPNNDLHFAIQLVQIISICLEEMPDFADEGGVVLLFAFLGVGEAGGLGGECEDVAVVAVAAALLLH